jgi:quercetin dioxygenase-like cupin family protein
VTVCPSTDLNAAQHRVDLIQRFLADCPPAECPVTNRFTPGLYSREIFMPAGTAIVSRVHKTEHQFAVLAGEALVWTEKGGVERLKAGHVGITKPGTRRVLYIPKDCRWVTFHPTNETDLQKLQDELTETPDVSHIDGDAAAKEIAQEIIGKLRNIA